MYDIGRYLRVIRQEREMEKRAYYQEKHDNFIKNKTNKKRTYKSKKRGKRKWKKVN